MEVQLSVGDFHLPIHHCVFQTLVQLECLLCMGVIKGFISVVYQKRVELDTYH